MTYYVICAHKFSSLSLSHYITRTVCVSILCGGLVVVWGICHAVAEPESKYTYGESSTTNSFKETHTCDKMLQCNKT